MPHIFISYSKKDTRELALSLWEALNDIEHVTAWMDHSLTPGRSWESEIQNEIRRCDVFLVLYSPDINRHINDIRASESYILEELAYARYTLKKSVIPIMAQQTEPPMGMTRIQYIDFAAGNISLNKLVQEILRQVRSNSASTSAEIKFVEKKTEEAIAQVEPSKEEMSAEEYFSRANAKAATGDRVGAIADYSEVIRVNPDEANAYNSRGHLRLAEGDINRAIKDFTEMIRLIPKSATGYNNRAEANFALGKYKLALSDFQEAIALKPDHRWALAGLAISCHALEQSLEAIELWQELMTEDERYGDADWVGKELNWRPELIEAARKLIATL